MGYENLTAKLMQRLGNSRGVAPPAPDGWVAHIEIESDEREDGRRDIAGCAFVIAYIDSAGRESNRRITVQRIWLDGIDFHVQAWCHERDALRMFKASRIAEMTDCVTGEIIGDAHDFIASEIALGDAPRVRKNPAWAALKRCRDGLNVLAYLARADGKFHQIEKQVMVDYVMAFAADRTSEKLVAREVARVWPDRQTFFESLDEFFRERTPDEVHDLMTRVVRIVQCDGEISEAEFELLSDVSDAAREVGIPLEVVWN